MLDAALQGLLLGGYYAILAAGLSLMFGVVRLTNLAHGDLAVLGAYLVLFCVERRKSWRTMQSRAGQENIDYAAQKKLLAKVDGGQIPLARLTELPETLFCSECEVRPDGELDGA